MNTTAYLVNISPCTSIECKTPNEVWSGYPAKYENLRIFGCPAYAHVKEGKLDPRAKKCVFLGYEPGVKGYRLWNPDGKSKKFLISRDVTFDELAMVTQKVMPVDALEGVGKQVEQEDHGEHVDFEIDTREEVRPQIDEQAEEDEHEEVHYSVARNRRR